MKKFSLERKTCRPSLTNSTPDGLISCRQITEHGQGLTHHVCRVLAGSSMRKMSMGVSILLTDFSFQKLHALRLDLPREGSFFQIASSFYMWGLRAHLKLTNG